MTSEIAILNKEAIALAADSAVTMINPAGEKIFTSANKLFALSKYHPIGIMIYGNALFMDVPWETIIKIYRKNLGDKSFPTVKDYGNDFINFLKKTNIFSDEIQDLYFKRTMYSYLNFIKNNIMEKVDYELKQNKKISEESIKDIIDSIIQEQYNLWKNSNSSPDISEDFHKKIIGKYEKVIKSVIKEVMEKLPLSDDNMKKLIDIIVFLFYKNPEKVIHTGMSGVVIAGFGDDEFFPSLVIYNVEGILDGSLKYKIVDEVSVNYKTGAIIMPFAQKDMIQLFMEGVHEDYLRIEQHYLQELLNSFLKSFAKKVKISEEEQREIINIIMSDFKKKISEYKKTYTESIMKVVSMLPKSELAMMAETLVNLTSLKRKWSTEIETVGGPIDVALISKGDGFIWIKRKHYFNPELNPYFFQKYYMEVKK